MTFASEEVAKLRRNNPRYYVYELIRKRVEVLSGQVSFSLKPKDIEIPERCPMRGVLFARGYGRRHPDSLSAIRIDLALGWVKGNILVVSWAARQALETVPDVVEPLESEPLPEMSTLTTEELAIEWQQVRQVLSKRLCLMTRLFPVELRRLFFRLDCETIGDLLMCPQDLSSLGRRQTEALRRGLAYFGFTWV